MSNPATSRTPQIQRNDSLEPRRRPILVIEDDPVDQEMISLAFKRASVVNVVITMANGQEALDYLSALQNEFVLPAVIILDLNMPLMDGFEFLRRIKAEPRFAALPVVVLTTSQFDRDLTQSYALGASSCLTKPADFEQLVQMAAEVDQYWCRRNRIPEGG
jgi:CheY-like chemotaxis protein